MSVLIQASISAEDRLAQAIDRFKALLTPAQAKEYAVAQNARPAARDVTILLSEVDRLVKTKHKTRGSFKPKLESVIMATQKFASICDVMIGGSQSLIACGAWSAVRISLLAITSSLSTINELASIFVAVGSCAPYHEELTILFPQSARLQALICEWHIVVVDICCQLLKTISKPIVSKLRFAFSDQNYRAQLERLGITISREVQLSMAKVHEQQLAETSKFRSGLLTRLIKNDHSKQMRARYKILKACSMYEYRSSLQQLQSLGIAEFYTRDTAYTGWLTKDCASTLIIDGKLGAGKSVLTASLVDNVKEKCPNHTVCYFFCRYDLAQSLLPRTIIGTLYRQILEASSEPLNWEQLLLSHPPPYTISTVWAIASRVLSSFAKVTMIIDGLDDCEASNQVAVIEHIRNLQKQAGCRICLSYRAQSTLPSWKDGWPDPNFLHIPDDNPDIKHYIRSELTYRIETGKLNLTNPALIEDIYKHLLDECNGMFLWTALSIDCICYETSDDRIRHSLRRLPKTLPELYARILKHAATEDTYHDQDRIFQIVLASFESITKDAMAEALAVVPGDTKYDPSRIIHDVDKLLARCSSLILVDEEYKTIHLLHSSAKQYLMTIHRQVQEYSMDEDSVQQKMADIIITYLSYGMFDHQVATIGNGQTSIHALPEQIIGSVLSSTTTKLAVLRILQKISTTDGSWTPPQSILSTTSDVSEQAESTGFRFYAYAKEYLLSHALFYHSDRCGWRQDLLTKLLGSAQPITLLTEVKLASFTWQACAIPDLQRLALQTDYSLWELRRLLTARDHFEQSLLEWCVQNNHRCLAKSFLLQYEFRGGHIAEYYGHEESGILADDMARLFCLAIKKEYFDIASAIFVPEFWDVLLRSTDSSFFHEICTLGLASEWSSINWVGSFIINQQAQIIDDPTIIATPLLRKITFSRKLSLAPKLALIQDAAIGTVWQNVLTREDETAIEIFCVLILVHLVCYLATKIQSHKQQQPKDSTGQPQGSNQEYTVQNGRILNHLANAQYEELRKVSLALDEAVGYHRGKPSPGSIQTLTAFLQRKSQSSNLLRDLMEHGLIPLPAP